MENRTARHTVLIAPVKKKLFEEICAQHDLTPSQVVRWHEAGSRQPAAQHRS